MTEADDELMLNLTNEGGGSSRKRQKISKQDRIKQKRRERREQEQLLMKASVDQKQHEQKSVITPKDSPPQKRENPKIKPQKRKIGSAAFDDNRDGDMPMKRYKPTLFYNNPDIPKLDNATVQVCSETVFSGDSFKSLHLHDHMISNLSSTLSVMEATSVQKRTIPEMLSGQDVLVKSQTGSGKTLAYAIPVVQYLQSLRPKIQRSDGPLALIIVPTRELALQSFAAFQKLVKPFTWVVPGCLMGGEKKKAEKARLRKGLNIVIATPGRLIDHIQNTTNLELGRVEWLVIDEADRLLDMGFEKEVSQVISVLKERGPKDRKTALLSATLSNGVERLAGMSLNNPTKVDITAVARTDVTSENDLMLSGDVSMKKVATPENLKHHCVMVPSKLRLVSLAAFILWKCKMATKRSKMVVFMSTQDSVDFHYRLFTNTLFDDEEEEKEEESNRLLYRLHGDMPQKERTQVFRSFSQAESGVLFCTDVAARGLDLPAVRWIIQYDSPGGSTDYIHRVGRTARIGHRGNALLYLAPAEASFTHILADNNIKLIEVEMDHILQTLLKEKHKLQYLWDDNVPPHTIQEAASLVQVRFTEHVRLDKDTRTLARKAFQSYIGAYTAYPSNVKHIFHVKNLHLGHVATSFALQEAPTKIGNIVGVHSRKRTDQHTHIVNRKTAQHKPRGPLLTSMHKSNLSEFSSGLDSVSIQTPLTKRARKKQHDK